MAISHYVEKRFLPANLTYLGSNGTFTANVTKNYPNVFCEATGENFAFLTFSFAAAPSAGTVTLTGDTPNKSQDTMVVAYASAQNSLTLPISLNRLTSITFSTNMTAVGIGYVSQEAYVTSDGGYTSHGVNVVGSNITWNIDGSLYDFNANFIKNPPTQLFYSIGTSTTAQTASTAELVYIEDVVGKFRFKVVSSNSTTPATVIWQCAWRSYK